MEKGDYIMFELAKKGYIRTFVLLFIKLFKR